MGRWIGVTDEEWSVIALHLPAEPNRNYGPAHDNRKDFEGMLWIARTGSQWRNLPSEYGKWNSVYQRFRRWVLAGVWDTLLQTLSDLAQTDTLPEQVDGNILQAQHDAAEVVRGIKTRKLWAARTLAFSDEVMLAPPAGTDRPDHVSVANNR